MLDQKMMREFEQMKKRLAYLETLDRPEPTPPFTDLPVGCMMDWPTDTAPNKWLFCYGQNISREIYSELFALIGIYFGAGDGITTFGIPDMRGLFSLTKDDLGGVPANRVTNPAADTIGAIAGVETVTLSQAQLPDDGLYWIGDQYGGGVGGFFAQVNITGGTKVHPTFGQGHENMPPYGTYTKIIYVGV
jgi:microcystin-dependent protein